MHPSGGQVISDNVIFWGKGGLKRRRRKEKYEKKRNRQDEGKSEIKRPICTRSKNKG
jgi:hypothetical protein